MSAQWRWPAFSLSFLGHAAAAAFLFWMDTVLPVAPSPMYKVIVIPKEPVHQDSIIWYNAPASIPEVAPEHAFGPQKQASGQKDPSDQTTISDSPDPASRIQVIRQPIPAPIAEDVPAPNLVAALPADRPAPKRFASAPPSTKALKTVHVLDSAPVLEAKAQAGPDLGVISSAVKLPPKAFVAPAHAVGPSPVPARVVPDAPIIASATPGAEIAIIGLNPTAGIPPPGSRSAQFARAPNEGVPSSGATQSPNAATVPNLVAHARPGAPPDSASAPKVPAPPKKVVKTFEFPGVNRTMSAPLRPSSRIIPPGVEAQFAHRDVYALVITRPDLPEYSDDWVMWFSARQTESDPNSRISAPLPERRYSAADPDPPPQSPPESATIRFAAVIDHNGRIGSAKILRSAASEAFRQKAAADLQSWEFKPALRNGEPMDVDIVLDIPMRLTLAVQP